MSAPLRIYVAGASAEIDRAETVIAELLCHPYDRRVCVSVGTRGPCCPGRGSVCGHARGGPAATAPRQVCCAHREREALRLRMRLSWRL